jgi:DNA-binding winged helix-turn-helix (wHTH) protein
VATAQAKTGLLVLVVGHLPRLEAPDGVAAMLRQLGAEVHTLDLWDDFGTVMDHARAAGGVRAMVFEAGERPDLATAALRAARKLDELSGTPSLVALPPRQITGFDPASGFDDFIVVPCAPAEIYARIRALEWDRSEFSTEERLKVGRLVVDRAAHEVTVDGRPIELTAKEFALLSFLATHRGRVHSRDTLLSRVWGSRYDGGARTVDIHVRRLRAKLGDALPLETLRGAGYKLRSPSEGGKR